MKEENEFFSAANALAITKTCSQKRITEQLDDIFHVIAKAAIDGYDGCRYYPSTLSKVNEILTELGYILTYVYQSEGRNSYTVINWSDQNPISTKIE